MKNILIALIILSTVGCNKILNRGGSHENTPQEPAVLTSVSGVIVRTQQKLDIHRLDLSKPFTVLINGHIIDRYEYTYFEGQTFLTLMNKVTRMGNWVTISTTPVANVGDTWEVQTL